jgi:hypothetical protein
MLFPFVTNIFRTFNSITASKIGVCVLKAIFMTEHAGIIMVTLISNAQNGNHIKCAFSTAEAFR